MVPNNIALIAFCVVISEAKLFIGDCSYGFCEQKCKQIRTDEMECFCQRGFALKGDGRKCIKSFVTDDEQSSGDDASGETGNCDNEDGNCDKSQSVVVYSGDSEDVDVKSSEEGSGAISLVNEHFGIVKSSIKAIPTNVSATFPLRVKTVYSIVKSEAITGANIEKNIKRLATSTTKISAMPTQIHEKHTVTKASTVKGILTIAKIHPILEGTTRLSTERLSTNAYELIPMQTQIDKKEIITASVETIPSIAKSKDIIGGLKSPIVISSQIIPTSTTRYSTVKSAQGIPTSSTIHSRKIVMHTKLVGDTPIRVSSISQKSVSKSILKSGSTSAYKYVPSLTGAPSRVKVSVVLDEDRKMLKSVETMSSVYQHIAIQTPIVSSKIEIKQTYTATANNVSVPIPTVVVYTKTGFIEIKKFVIQDGEEMPIYPAEHKSSKYLRSDKIGVPTFPNVTIPVPYGRSTNTALPKIRVPVMESIQIHNVPLKVTIIKTDIRVPTIDLQTKKIKSVDKTVSVNIDITESSSKSLEHPIYKSTVNLVDTSIIHVSNVSEEKVQKIRKTIKGSISSVLTKSSFHMVVTSTETIEKTTPLEVVNTHIVVKSRFIDLPLRQSSYFTYDVVDKTLIDLKEKDFLSTTSRKSPDSSDSLIISDKVKRTEVKSYNRTTSSRFLSEIILPSSAGLRKTEQSDKKIVIQSSPTKRVTETETKHVIVITGKAESHQCRLLVNSYLLTVITFFTIYFLSVH